jgi:hypothetical protein
LSELDKVCESFDVRETCLDMPFFAQRVFWFLLEGDIFNQWHAFDIFLFMSE